MEVKKECGLVWDVAVGEAVRGGQWVYGNSVLSTQFQCEPQPALKIVCAKKMGRKYFFNVEFFSPELKKSVIHNNRGPGGVNVSASHLPWRSDCSESGDHCGPQILVKLVFALPE